MSENILMLTISARNLSRNFGSYPAVKEINLELKHGEVLGFLGSNGAGKTTTMRMLTGNLAPTSGSVEICGIDLLEKPIEAKTHIGYLPETPPLYKELTVNEYLQLVAKLHRISSIKICSTLEEIKLQCGLKDIGNTLINSLSKGYQQRVGIAQAIIHDPDVIILDEPTVGLDPNQIREILSLIRSLGTKRSVILSTHVLSEVTSICDRVQIMHSGEMVLNDSLSGLKEKEISLDDIFSQLTTDNKTS